MNLLVVLCSLQISKKAARDFSNCNTFCTCFVLHCSCFVFVCFTVVLFFFNFIFYFYRVPYRGVYCRSIGGGICI